EDRFQPQGAGTVLLGCDPVHGAKPVHQRLAGGLEDRPPRHPGLGGPLAALQQDQAPRPVLIAITTLASETLRPPQAEQVVPARLLGRKPNLKLAQVPRVFLHSPPYYRLCRPESSK